MRALLVQPGIDLTHEESISYTAHSWRHFLPTAGAQLDFSPSQLETIGHWAPGSRTAEMYCTTKCVQELAVKSKLLHCFHNGFRIAEDYNVPVGLTSDPIAPSQTRISSIVTGQTPFSDITFAACKSSGKYHIFHRDDAGWSAEQRARACKTVSTGPFLDLLPDKANICKKCFFGKFQEMLPNVDTGDHTDVDQKSDVEEFEDPDSDVEPSS